MKIFSFSSYCGQSLVDRLSLTWVEGCGRGEGKGEKQGGLVNVKGLMSYESDGWL